MLSSVTSRTRSACASRDSDQFVQLAGKIHEHGPEFAFGDVHDLDDLLAGNGIERHQRGRRGNHLQTAGMLHRRCAQQFSVDASPRLDQVEEGELRPESKLEGGISELQVEIKEADLATDTFLVLGGADRELREQRGCADAPNALDGADHLAVRRVRGRRVAMDLIPDRQKRRFEIGDIERERDHVVRPGPHELPDQRQRGVVRGRDQRRSRRRCEFFEAH